MAIYLGKRPQGDLIRFECEGRPTHASTAGRIVSAIGPFASGLGAIYFIRYGQQAGISPAEADRLTLEDPNPVWQLLSASLLRQTALFTIGGPDGGGALLELNSGG